MPRLRRWWQFWWFWHPYSDWNVARQGRRDAQAEPPIPPWGSPQQPQFIDELREAGEHDVSILAGRWSNRDAVLKERWLNADARKEQAKGDEEKAREAHEDACEAYKKEHNNVPPPTGGASGLALYWFLIALMFVCEFPINAIVFRLFGENEVFTYIATAALALALLASAHFLGMLLREGEFKDIRNVVIIVALVLVPVAAIVSVSYLREVYLERTGDVTTTMSPGKMQGAFACFNALIFLVATVASYVTHDKLLIAVFQTRKQLRRAARARAVAERRFNKAQTRREQIFRATTNEAERINNTVQRLVAVYRRENLRYRGDRGNQKGMPQSFQTEVAVEIPTSLKQLDWTRPSVQAVPSSSPEQECS